MAVGTNPTAINKMTTVIQTIAIATTPDNQCGHFDRCPTYTIVRVDMAQKHISQETIINSPALSPAQRLLLVQEAGAQIIIATQMNGPLQIVCVEQGIPPLLGVTGVIPTVLTAFMNNTLHYGHAECEPHE